MAVSRINNSNPIVYGGSAITPAGTGPVSFYTTAARDISIADTSSLGFYQEINGRYLANDWVESGGILAGSGETSAPSGLAMDAVCYFPAPGITRHTTLYGINYGYDSAPGSGVLTVESPSGTVIYGPIPVTSAGANYNDFAKGLKAPANTELLVKLKAVSGAHAMVGVKGRRTE